MGQKPARPTNTGPLTPFDKEVLGCTANAAMNRFAMGELAGDLKLQDCLETAIANHKKLLAETMPAEERRRRQLQRRR